MMTFLGALALLQAASAGTPPAPAPAPPSCDSEQHAAFDFWVGEWDVYQADGADSGEVIARSRIEKLYRGCGVRENWMPLGGSGGGSLNAYDPSTGLWHQTWIGSAPGHVDFEGGPVGDGMILVGRWPGASSGEGNSGADRDPAIRLIRMTYTPEADGSVRQHGEESFDHGRTWGPSFDLIYRPRKETSE